MNKLDRITIDPQVFQGEPCIRGLRIPVSLIIKLISAGKTPEDIIKDYPELESEDIKQASEKEIRKQLSGTPEEVAPHIIRVAREFRYQGFSYDGEEERIPSDKFSKNISIHRVTSWLDPHEFLIRGDQGLPHEVLPHFTGGIVLQPLPNSRTLFIARYSTPSCPDCASSHFDNFLRRLSAELKNIGFEKPQLKRLGECSRKFCQSQRQ
jgi:uncharacterized protein (DUF433 family)